MASTEGRLRMLEAQQLQLLQAVTTLHEDVREITGRSNKRQKVTHGDAAIGDLLESFGAEEKDSAPPEGVTLPAVSAVTSMDQDALRRTWEQLKLGPLRKNASIVTMRRAIKEYIRAHSSQ